MNWNSYWLWTGEMPLLCVSQAPYQMAALQLAWIRIGKQHSADYRVSELSCPCLTDLLFSWDLYEYVLWWCRLWYALTEMETGIHTELGTEQWKISIGETGVETMPLHQ